MRAHRVCYASSSARRKLRHAVPTLTRPPEPKFPLDLMVNRICPKTGSGAVRARWKTRRNIVVDREWLIQRGLPGEVVTLDFGKVTWKRFPKGDLDIFLTGNTAVQEESPYQVHPPCPHYNTCGGCDFLGLRYGRQLVEKQRWVEKALVGSKAPISVLKRIRPSEPQLRYAHRMQWVLSEEDGRLSCGPSGAAPEPRGEEPPSRCVLVQRSAAQALGAIYEAFLEAWRGDRKRYSVYEERRGTGTFKALEVICTRAPAPAAAASGGAAAAGVRRTELLLNIVLAREVTDMEGLLQPLVAAALPSMPKSSLVGIVANVARSKQDVMGGRREMLLHGRRYARQAFARGVGEAPTLELHVGAASRMLAHPRALTEVADAVSKMCGVGESDVVWHCFSGGGELSLAVAAACEHVVSIGTSATEVAELKRNLATNKASNITAVLTNLRSPWSLKQLSFHVSQSQQQRLLLGTGEEQVKARDYCVAAFVPGEGRRRQMQRQSASPFTAPLLRQDALAYQQLQVLLPAFIRDFHSPKTTLPVPTQQAGGDASERHYEVPPEMESRLKRLYRSLALQIHPDQNPDDPDAAERFLALSRAYKALVGDTAGPEEGDHLARDPFKDALAARYRPKFKERWRQEGNYNIRLNKVYEERLKEQEESTGKRLPLELRGRKRKAAEAEKHDGASDDPFASASDGDEQDTQEEVDDEEEYEEENEAFELRMEIDSTWSTAPVDEPEPASPSGARSVDERADEPAAPGSHVTLRREGDVYITPGGEVRMPTLPPPDVIIVSQPRARKRGVGTPRHFHSWLRTTAVRTIVYVATDAEAFRADLRRLMDLGYRLSSAQPFDPEPHRRSLLLVARLDLIRPLAGSEEMAEEGLTLLGGAPASLQPDERFPLLGSGGYRRLEP